MTIGDIEFTFIEIDPDLIFSSIIQLGEQSFTTIVWQLFRGGFWFVIFCFFIYAFRIFWLAYVRAKFDEQQEFIILAVNVPADNEQSPKAVENIFTNFTAILGVPTYIEKYWNGSRPRAISLEIVSIDGYIQFLIRISAKFRDVVEAGVYAQYPDAEITEIEDYVENVPHIYPDEHYKMFGMEFILGKEDAYPIRTYEHFEDSMAKELKDPMASLLEVLSRLETGEQVWLQFVIRPVLGKDWEDKSQEVVDKIMGKKKVSKESLILRIIGAPFKILSEVIRISSGAEPTKSGADGGTEQPAMQRITPGERDVIEAIQNKAAKMGFRTKFRLVYLGRNEVFTKAKGVSAVFGAIRQFNTQNLNFFMPDLKTLTHVDYFFTKSRIKSRQKKMMYHYVNRTVESGSKGQGFILNIEELASVYHFPLFTVKAPMLKRVSGKKSEPPVGLAVLPGAPIPTAKASKSSPKVTAESKSSDKSKDSSKPDITSVFTDMPIAPPSNKQD